MFRYMLSPVGSIDEFDKVEAESIVARLRELSGDASLILVQVKEGSVRLVLEGTREGFERIRALFQSGRLTEELGVEVSDMAWLGTPSEDEASRTPSDSAIIPTARISKSHRIKILFVSANPTSTSRLALDEEIREITAKIRATEYRESLELVSQWAVRPDDLLQALLEHKPYIVHFSGHGTRTNEIILSDQQGRPKAVSKAALVSLFRNLKDNVRVVVLNACSTRPQAEAITQTIDCVIGMNQPVGDAAAIVFAASFYRAIGFGRSVQEAFELGKTALLLEGIPEESTPELLLRKGINASDIFLIPAR